MTAVCFIAIVKNNISHFLLQMLNGARKISSFNNGICYLFVLFFPVQFSNFGADILLQSRTLRMFITAYCPTGDEFNLIGS